MNLLVSIIIPVYNCEKYIGACINSCITQTYENIQIIVINDGSTDKSASIVKQLAKSDFRIQLINKENGGVSSARNLGIRNAKGDYIIFLDGDDRLDSNAINKLIAKMSEINTNNETVLVCCGRNTIITKKGKQTQINNTVSLKNETIDQYHALSYVGTGKFNLQSACYKLFNRSIIVNKKLQFDESIDFGEDGLFVFEYLCHISRLEYLNAPLWNIVVRKESAQRSHFSKKKLSAIEAIKRMKKITPYPDMMNNKLDLYIVEKIEELLSSAIRDGISKNEADINSLRKEIRQHKYLIVKSRVSFRRKIRFFQYAYLPLFMLKNSIYIVNFIKTLLKKCYYKFKKASKEINTCE